MPDGMSDVVSDVLYHGLLLYRCCDVQVFQNAVCVLLYLLFHFLSQFFLSQFFLLQFFLLQFFLPCRCHAVFVPRQKGSWVWVNLLAEQRGAGETSACEMVHPAPLYPLSNFVKEIVI